MNKIHTGYYEERRSRFYCYMSHVSSTEETTKLKEIALKAEKSIKHCVSVRFFRDERNNLVTIISNSGEPIKAAEKILMTLKKNNVQNIAVMVSRHYGGTPLGANNLTRAYYKAFKNAYSEFLKQTEEKI